MCNVSRNSESSDIPGVGGFPDKSYGSVVAREVLLNKSDGGVRRTY